VNEDNEPTDYALFEKECMVEWKREYDLKNDRKRGKKRPADVSTTTTNYELEDLCREFNIEAV